MMFGAGWELRHMSISELMHRSERARRLEVFTGAGRRRNWPADEKAAIVAESYAPGRTVCGVARRHGLTPAQLFTWRRLARRSRSSVKLPPALFVTAVVEASPGPPPPASQPQRARQPGPVMGIEVETDGVVVRIGSGASPQAIAAVIRALKVGPPAADRPGSFGEQGREGDRADPGQRMQNGCVGRRTALWRRGPFTQACAQLIQLALGLIELAVSQAQASHQRAQMQNGSFGDPLSHWDRGLTQEANHLLGINPADPMLLKQPGQRRLAQACGLGRGGRQCPQLQDPFGCHIVAHREQLRIVAPELLADAVREARALLLQFLC